MNSLLLVLITACCLLSGYGFYKMNHGDVINAVCFTIGILGIMLSFARSRLKQ